MKKIKIVDSFDELIKELGIKPGDKIQIMTPQFERDYELEIKFTPQDESELKALIETASIEILKKMGVCVWSSYKQCVEDNEPDIYLKPGEIHYLFPEEWYDHIPNGFEIVDIFGTKEKFTKGETDDDIRFGCLSFGFVRSF
jgi:hypothetical protein